MSVIKPKKILLCIIISMILFVACNLNNSETGQAIVAKNINETSEELKYTYTVKGNTSDEFAFIIEDNPIDEEYKDLHTNYDGSSRLIIEYANKYKEWWQLEMDVAYDQLLQILEEEDCQNLATSQASWEEYMKSKKNMEVNFFYNDKYDTVGNLRKALSVSEEAEETRARAYSLLEYLYIITGEINLIFTPIE